MSEPHDTPQCEHEWETLISSMYSNEWFEAVECKKCHVSGERHIETKIVNWPCT